MTALPPNRREVDLAEALVESVDCAAKSVALAMTESTLVAYREELLCEFEQLAAAWEDEDKRLRAAGIRDMSSHRTATERAAEVRAVIARLRGSP
jgi:hypothetical protein